MRSRRWPLPRALRFGPQQASGWQRVVELTGGLLAGVRHCRVGGATRCGGVHRGARGVRRAADRSPLPTWTSAAHRAGRRGCHRAQRGKGSASDLDSSAAGATIIDVQVGRERPAPPARCALPWRCLSAPPAAGPRRAFERFNVRASARRGGVTSFFVPHPPMPTLNCATMPDFDGAQHAQGQPAAASLQIDEPDHAASSTKVFGRYLTPYLEAREPHAGSPATGG